MSVISNFYSVLFSQEIQTIVSNSCKEIYSLDQLLKRKEEKKNYEIEQQQINTIMREQKLAAENRRRDFPKEVFPMRLSDNPFNPLGISPRESILFYTSYNKYD